MTTEQAVKHLEDIRAEVENKISCLPPLMRDRTSLHSVAQALKMAVDALKDQENNRWIPVSERLPDEYQRYLCNIKSFAFPGRYYVDILKYDRGGFIDGYIYTDDVTHWMPLPEEQNEDEC